MNIRIKSSCCTLYVSILCPSHLIKPEKKIKKKKRITLRWVSGFLQAGKNRGNFRHWQLRGHFAGGAEGSGDKFYAWHGPLRSFITSCKSKELLRVEKKAYSTECSIIIRHIAYVPQQGGKMEKI